MSRLLPIVLSLLWLTALPARAAAPDGAAAPNSVWLEDLTSPELAARVRDGTTTVIVPVGGVEQSGPAIALGKHDARVRVLAERIARALGHTVVAPVMPFVPEGNIAPPTSHMRFAGTLSVPAEAFRKILAAEAASLVQHGFRSVVLIGDHGGYQGDLAAVAAELDRRWAGTPARAHYIAAYYRAATADFGAVLRARGYTQEEIGTHAGAADTSLTMAIAPADVRADALKAGAGLDAAHGVYGDPRRASADLGRIAADAIVDTSVAAIRAAMARDPRT